MILKSRNKVDPQFSLSSMTDIVFLLLVFFLIATNTPNALDLLLPKAKGKTTTVKNITVSIDKQQIYYLNDEEVDENRLERKLKRLVKKLDKPIIILRAEESVPIDKAVFVMDIANRNNIKVILAVRPY